MGTFLNSISALKFEAVTGHLEVDNCCACGWRKTTKSRHSPFMAQGTAKIVFSVLNLSHSTKPFKSTLRRLAGVSSKLYWFA